MGVEVLRKAHRAAVIVLALASATYVLPLGAEQRAPSTGYEAASFRPSRPGDPRRPGFEFLPGGRFRLTNSPLLPVIATAYSIPWQSIESVRLRMKGLPDWMLTDRYDLEVTAEKATEQRGASPLARTRNERTRLMLQAVLEDRLKLRIRRTTAEMPIYSLEVGIRGPKLQIATTAEQDCAESAPFAPKSSSAPGCHQFQGGAGRGIRGLAVDMSDLALHVSNWSDLPVVDHTGLKRLYAIQTEGWDRSESDSSRLTLDEILDRLGLKLVRKKSAVEVFVIEHIEKPSEN
jgi:uncharacterized protein (TIGR03435 family)